jgi:Ca-activated chloride channel homolog
VTGDVFGRLELSAPWLLAAVPVAVLLLVLARGRGRSLVRFPSVALAATVPATWRVRLAWLPAGLLGLGVVLAGVALARPRLGDERTVVRTQGIAIQLVVDRSSSMLAHDFTDAEGRPTSRLAALKHVVRDFVAGGGDLPGRPNDAVGLTSFAGFAETLVPLTLDHDLVLQSLDAVEVADTRLEDGTSIGLGLAVGAARLREAESAESRIMVLLTDGVNNDPQNDPMAAARAAKELGIRVYTVGMGTTGHAPYPQVGPDGTVRWRRLPVEIDEALLAKVAQDTGGTYARAQSTEGLREVYAAIDRLERSEIAGLTYRRFRELFALPLGGAAVAWALSLLLERTLLRRLG